MDDITKAKIALAKSKGLKPRWPVEFGPLAWPGTREYRKMGKSQQEALDIYWALKDDKIQPLRKMSV